MQLKMKAGCGKTEILMKILMAGVGFAHFDKWLAE